MNQERHFCVRLLSFLISKKHKRLNAVSQQRQGQIITVGRTKVNYTHTEIVGLVYTGFHTPTEFQMACLSKDHMWCWFLLGKKSQPHLDLSHQPTLANQLCSADSCNHDSYAPPEVLNKLNGRWMSKMPQTQRCPFSHSYSEILILHCKPHQGFLCVSRPWGFVCNAKSDSTARSETDILECIKSWQFVECVVKEVAYFSMLLSENTNRKVKLPRMRTLCKWINHQTISS